MSSGEAISDDAFYILRYSEPDAVVDARIYAVINQKVETVGMGAKQRLCAFNKEQNGHWNLRWKLIPNSHYAQPKKVIPGSPLTKKPGQRFTMNDLFRLGLGDGFQGFGCGQIMAVDPEKPTHIRVAAIGTITQGQGGLRGKRGFYTVEGTMDLKRGFHGLIMLRIGDQPRKPVANQSVTPGRETVFLPKNAGLYCFNQVASQTQIYRVQASSRSPEVGDWWSPGNQIGVAHLESLLPLAHLENQNWGNLLTPLPYLSRGECQIGPREDWFSFHLLEGRAMRQSPGSNDVFISGFGQIMKAQGKYSQGVILISGRTTNTQTSGCMLVSL